MCEESQHPTPKTSSELKSLEAMLASLSPMPVIDRDHVVYEAGRAAGAAQRIHQNVVRQRVLSCGVAALLVLSVTTSALWIGERGASPIVADDSREIRVDQPQPEESSPDNPPTQDELRLAEDPREFTFVTLGTHNYLQLRDRVLEEGPEALPPPATFTETDNEAPIPMWRGGLGGI